MKNKDHIFDIIISIVISFLFTLSTTWNIWGKFDVIKFLIFGIIHYAIFYFLWKKIKNFELKKPKDKILKREFIIYAIFILVVLAFAIIAYYPGFIESDTLNQYAQVQNNSYGNWHPVMHTLFLFRLPTLIYNNYISCTIFQCLIIFGILLYFCYFLRKNFLTFKYTLLILLLLILNPLFMHYSILLLKDVLFSWSVFLTTLLVINIVITNGKWIKKWPNKLFFILSSLGILFFRHNGIISFILVYLSLIIFYSNSRKFFTISLLGILIGNYIITNPVYEAFNINNATGGKTEMIGTLMGQVSYYNHVGILSEQDQELLKKFTTLEEWDKYYHPSNFNVFKWNVSSYSWVANKNFNEIIKLWLRKSVNNPAIFIKSFLNMSSPVWLTETTMLNVEKENTNKDKIEILSDQFLKFFGDYTYTINHTPLRWLFTDIGESLFAIICFAFIVIRRTKWNLKSLLPFVAVVSNSFAIMCLITGGEVRFVYSQTICVLPLLVYSLSNYVKKDLAKEKTKLEKFIKKYFVDKTSNTLVQFVRYIFVGGIAAIVNIGMLYVFTDLFKIYYIISNILAFILGLVVNYLLSKKFVFQEKTSITKKKEFIIYAIIGVIGLGIDTILVWLFTSLCSIYYLLSKVISTLLVFIWNFVARKILYKVVK